MVQLLAGFQVCQALYAAAKLGAADNLRSGPRDAEALAADVGAGAQALHRVLHALASIEVFAETGDGLFALTPLGETLTQDSQASMRDLAIMWMETHYGPFGDLLGTVRTGRCAATEFYGQPFFGWLSGQPDLTMLGMLTGRERTEAEYRRLLERAGFTFEAVTATRTPISVISARA